MRAPLRNVVHVVEAPSGRKAEALQIQNFHFQLRRNTIWWAKENQRTVRSIFSQDGLMRIVAALNFLRQFYPLEQCMQIGVEHKNGFIVATIAGKIDATTSPEFEDRMMNLIDDGAKYIILDLGEVPYLSSAGLRILILLAKHLYGTGQLALCNVRETVDEIISMAGFKNYMLFFSTREDAEANIFN